MGDVSASQDATEKTQDESKADTLSLSSIKVSVSDDEHDDNNCVRTDASEELETLLSDCAQLIGKLRDSTRFSYAGVFATTLSLLFFSNEERYDTLLHFFIQ